MARSITHVILNHPIFLLMGWFSQKQLVRGLTFGAVK